MKSNIITFGGIVILLFSVGLVAFQSGKNSVKTYQKKSRIKISEKKVKTYQKEYDSLQIAYLNLEKEKQKIQTLYIQGKKTIQYITKERTEMYTDTLCKEDVIQLKNHISVSDSLISYQHKQNVNTQNRLTTAEKILREQEQQIELYKDQKVPSKPLGIGIMAGYGTDFQHGFSPFLGIGISYSLIRL